MYVFFRPCNEKDAIIFLVMLISMVGVFSVVKGAEQCGKN